MTWYQALRGNYIFLRLPIKNKFCAHGKPYDCGFGTCALDGRECNLAECPGKCLKFKPVLSQRLALAFRLLFWRGSNS